MTLPNSQHQYQLVRQAKGFSLQLREGAPIRAPGPREVLVQILDEQSTGLLAERLERSRA